MVDCQVTFLEDRRQFELVRSHLVMTGLHRNTQFQCLNLQILHESGYTGRNGTEIMVFQLLVLGSFMPHQRTSGEQQVWTGGIQSFVYQEIFLFPSQISHHLLHIRVKIVTNIYSCLINRTQRLQQRSFVVQRFTGISDKYSRDTQRIIHNKDRRRWVPGTISTSLEGITDTTVRKRRGIRFLLYQ